MNDKEWRDALSGYIDKDFLEKETPEKIIYALMAKIRGYNAKWRTEIAKYFPEIMAQSFEGPERTIKWLMNKLKK